MKKYFNIALFVFLILASVISIFLHFNGFNRVWRVNDNYENLNFQAIAQLKDTIFYASDSIKIIYINSEIRINTTSPDIFDLYKNQVLKYHFKLHIWVSLAVFFILALYSYFCKPMHYFYQFYNNFHGKNLIIDNKNNGYYNHIDGMRVLAVLAVIIFHINNYYLPAGFLGVDIFFVISGFVITKLIYHEYQQGQFSFKMFYYRRVARILPALFAVIIFSVVAFHFILFTNEYEKFSHQILAALSFVSNFYYYAHTGYFDNDALLKPFLHTWSLAVEEQFYIIYPILLIGILKLWGNKLSIIMGILLALIIASMGLSSVLVHINFECNFYMLSSRIFELLAGAAMVFCMGKYNFKYQNLLAWLAIFMVGMALFLFNEKSPLPSFYTLPVILGVAIIIVLYNATLVKCLFSNIVMVFVGRRSYSLYLWHFPILSIIHYFEYKITAVFAVSILIVLIIIAHISYKYIETPMRQLILTNQRRFFAILWGKLCVIFILLVVFNIWQHNTRLANNNNLLEIIDRPAGVNNYQERQKNIIPQLKEAGIYVDEFSKKNNIKILMVGDSMIDDVMMIFLENKNNLSNIEIKTIHIERECQFIYKISVINEQYKDKCQNLITQFQKQWERNQSIMSYLFLGFVWDYNGITNLKNAINHFQINPNKLVVIGAKHFKELNRFKLRELDENYKPIDDLYWELELLMKQNAMGYYLSFFDILCNAGNKTCQQLTPDGNLISWDGIHTTIAGAKYLSQLFFQDENIKKIINGDNFR